MVMLSFVLYERQGLDEADALVQGCEDDLVIRVKNKLCANRGEINFMA